MKILAFADLHGWFDILDEIHEKVVKENVDLVICAGDMSVFSRDLDLVLERMNDIGTKVLVIHGNHESDLEVKKLCSKYDNLMFIHKSSYFLNNYAFFGYGGGGFSKRDENFVKVTKKFEEFWNEKYEKKDAKLTLILHGPPHKTKLDLIGDNHVGNQDFTDFIKRVQPDLVICGHLHDNFKKQDKIGKSKIINPGPEGKIIEL
jgi:Icc-related predicted phosphoesterase